MKIIPETIKYKKQTGITATFDTSFRKLFRNTTQLEWDIKAKGKNKWNDIKLKRFCSVNKTIIKNLPNKCVNSYPCNR